MAAEQHTNGYVMDTPERLQARLENIQSVDLLLSALRTISLGSWNKARKQLQALDGYTSHLKRILGQLSAHLPAQWGAPTRSEASENIPSRTILLVIGSERGLCGGFNRTILKSATDYLKECGSNCEIWALGSRIVRYIRQETWPLAWSAPLSMMALPSFDLVNEIAHTWLGQFQELKLEQVDVLFNCPRSGTGYTPATLRLIPPSPFDNQTQGTSDPWPPPILETNPRELYIHILEQFILIRLYTCLLQSAAAEHAARFQLLEDASQNASHLTEELRQSLNTARRQEITAEIQTLVVGAGLAR